MTQTLIIRTANGDFDLFGNERVSQTISIFNLESITSRPGEYTNTFTMPLTNKNREIIEHADFIPSVNTLPYRKIECLIISDGLPIKPGFIEIETITDVIKAKIYSGNSVFYDLVKNIYLSDLDWSSYDHVWNLANAVASSANTSGYTYPVIDYGGQTLSGDIVDVRKVLPTTFNSTILELIFEKLGYTYENNLLNSNFNKSVIPYTNKNPQISTQVLLLNQVDIGNTNNYSPVIPNYISKIVPAFYNYFTDQAIANTSGFLTPNRIYIPLDYNLINTPGSSGNYDFLNRKFTADYNGTYDYDFKCQLVDYDYMLFSFDKNLINFEIHTSTELIVFKKSGGVTTIINTEISNTGYSITTGSGSYPFIPAITQTFLTDTITGSVYLSQGDQLSFSLRIKFFCIPGSSVSTPYTVTGTFTPTVKDTATLQIDLQPQLVFGQLITYASMLPKLKCSDWLKDMCIRFGVLLNINEDTKIVKSVQIDSVKDNIPNHVDWSDKLNEDKEPEQKFKLDTYAQNNNFKHAEDKTILSTPGGTDYNMVINNGNLILEKDLYLSPFSATVNVDFNGTITSYINLYDVNTGRFDNDVKPRICFREAVTGLFKFTDGTTTSGYINTNRVWFIDESLPDLCMGFSYLIPRNSATIMSTLQNLRLVKADFNLTIIDIKGIDFLIPVYIEKFQSYFFISTINQFEYTQILPTEVDLIKLNP